MGAGSKKLPSLESQEGLPEGFAGRNGKGSQAKGDIRTEIEVGQTSGVQKLRLINVLSHFKRKLK